MSSPTAKSQQPQQQAAGGVFVVALTGRHVATDPQSLLAGRRLTWSKDYGWTYDVWVDDPGKYALTGANSRFALPAIGQRIAGLLTDVTSTAATQLQQLLQQHHQQQQCREPAPQTQR